MCKFVFWKDNSNNVLLLTFIMCSITAAPPCICTHLFFDKQLGSGLRP